MTKSRILFGLTLALLTLATLPAQAQHEKLRARPDSDAPKKPAEIIKDEQKLETLLYKPDYCDFSATFPSEPIQSHRCEEDNPERCYDLVSYTKVFDMTSTVKAEIVCNPLPSDAFDQYTPEAMKTMVESMAMGEVMQGFEPNVQEEANFKQAGMIGRGRAGMGDTIFVAQLWVGRNSIMAVQAEIMGEASDEAEEHFAEILRAIAYNESPEEKAARLEAEKKAAEEAAKNPEQNKEAAPDITENKTKDKKEASPKETEPKL